MDLTNLMIDYLVWAKNHDSEIDRLNSTINLADSSVLEPTVLKDIKEILHYDDFQQKVKSSNPWGYPKLISQIAHRYEIDESCVLTTSSASSGIFITCFALLDKEDEVIVEQPFYQPLAAAPNAIGVTIKKWSRDKKTFSLNLNEVENLITDKTKLIILTNLHNPSSAYTKDEDFVEISRIARKHSLNFYIIVDEIYHDFVKYRPTSVAKLGKEFISINSLSKIYGLSLLQCGWILAEPSVIERFRKVYIITQNQGSSLTEYLSSKVFENLDEYSKRSRKIVNQNRKIMQQYLNPLLKQGFLVGEIQPYGSTYFPKLAGIRNRNTQDIINQLVKKCHVVSGHFFDSPNHIRIGLGKSDNFEEAIKNLANEIKDIYLA